MTDPEQMQRLFAALQEAHRPCPDCDSHTVTVVDAGVIRVIVMHDDTCPALQAAEREDPLR